MARRLLALALASTLLMASSAAGAASLVSLSAAPILGSRAPSDGGWFGYLVRIESHASRPLRGTLRLSTGDSLATMAPFSLGPGAEATVQLVGRGLTSASLHVEATDEVDGSRLARIAVDPPHVSEPLLLDLGSPSRLAAELSGSHIAIGYSPPTSLPLNAPTLSVSTPYSGSTGEVELPLVAAAYGSVTLMVAPSEVLARLPAPAVAAVSDWLLAGGSLAITITRPEDVRASPLADWVGGKAMRVPPPPQVLETQTFLVAATDPRTPGTAPLVVRRSLAPDELLAATLDGFSGGNLRPTRWGATATYGLGEVHLLPYDTTSPEQVTDPWVRASMLDLVRHAWDRRAHVAMPTGSTIDDFYRLRAIERLMDPNEGVRWTVISSTLLLLVYALVAGPGLFWRARRRGRPLAVLWQLPLLSGGTMLLIVALGLGTRGVRGHARHLSLVEAGAGMTRAKATRFRAFYAGTSRELSLGSLDADAVLDVVGPDQTHRTLVTGPRGAHLERVVVRPWETMMVREDSFADLGGGVSVTRAGTDVRITNRTARPLIGVVARVPAGDLRYFDRLEDGQSVLVSEGEPLHAVGPTPTSAATHPLGAYRMRSELDRASSGLGDAWSAFESLAPDADWWPEDVPVVVGQLAGGEGNTTDARLTLESDRALLRLVGYGGPP